MNTHFLQPARVQMESREVTAPATLYNQLARTWLAAGTPVVKTEGEANATINETITVNAAGPIAPGEDVMLSVFEGAGTLRYKNYSLRTGQPVARVVPMAEILAGNTLEVPAPKVTLSFALDEKAAPTEQLAPGVRRQTLTSGVAFEFNTPQPIRFAQDQVVFVGRRGGIQIDTAQKTVRLILLDGQQIGYDRLQADVGTGPYDLTFHHDKVVGVSEGPGRFIHVTMPEGIVQLPALTVGGISCAPGTYGHVAIVPVLDGRCEFTLENLPQPPVFRSWQQW